MIFFSTLAVRRTSTGRILSEKNMGLRGYFLKKQKLYMQNLTKERKQPLVVILQRSNFYNIFIRCFWLRIIRRSAYGVQFMDFPSYIFFNDINNGYRAATLKKGFCGCFRLIWLLLLIAVIKKWAERCALQLYGTSLNDVSLSQLTK